MKGRLRILLAAGLIAGLGGNAKASDMDVLLEQLGCTLRCDTILYMSKVSQSKPVIIRVEDDLVTHAGVSIFSDETKALVNRPVCNFIERLFLRLRILPANESQVYLIRNKVSVKLNGVNFGNGSFKSVADIIDIIAEPTTFRLVRVSNTYNAYFEFGTNYLEINIPASRELIFGTDKKESDAQIEKKLRNSDNAVQTVQPEVSIGQLLMTDTQGIYRLPGSMLLTEQLRNDQYYFEKSGKLQPVFDKAYPDESITNLLLGIVDTDISIRIKHRAYGRYTPDIIVPINSLQASLGDGFKIFATTYALRSGKMQAVAIFQNEEYDFIHMLIITADATEWFAEKPEITADLFTNVPQHNVQNLFQTKK